MSFTLITRAERLAAAERWSEVANLLEPVIETSQSAGLWSMLAMARLRTGRRSGAADALLRSAALDAEEGRAWLNAAAVLDQEGRADEAGDAAQRALDMGFAPAEAHYFLGRGLRGVGDFESAEAAFRVAIAARPTFAAAHRELV